VTEHEPSLKAVLSTLAEEDQLTGDWSGRAEAALAGLEEGQPWFVRALVGVGAWLASLLLVTFVVGVNLVTSDEAFIVTGALLILAAVVVRRQVNNDFLNQAALASSLAGQVLLAFGVMETFGSHELEVALIALMVSNGILIATYPDRTHRFLSVGLIVGAGVGLLYDWKSQWLLAYLAPLLAGGYALLQEGRLATPRDGGLRGPVMAGLMFSAFGVVMLSTLYVFPELLEGFEFYPNPWVSSLLFGVLLVYAEWKVLGRASLGAGRRVIPAIYGLSLLIVLAALQAPGLVYALLVMLLGAGQGNRVMTGTGLAFLVVFVGAYFYGVDISLLMKSLSLLATGLVMLAGRWGLLALWPQGEAADGA
jgi:hypothetical protein